MGETRDDSSGAWMVVVVVVDVETVVDAAETGVGSVEALDTADSGVNGVNGVRVRGDSSERAERWADSTGVLPERKRLLCEECGVVADPVADPTGRRDDPESEDDAWWCW